MSSVLKTGFAGWLRVGRISPSRCGGARPRTSKFHKGAREVFNKQRAAPRTSSPAVLSSPRCLLSLRKTLSGWSQRQVVVVPGAIPEGEFLADHSTSFESLGIDPAVSDALLRAGFARPANVQAAGMPKVVQGKDVLVAAETGSGKTITYLAPIISKLVQQKKQRAGQEGRQERSFAVVLCPNGTLCNQVKSVADSLMTPEGESLATTLMVYQAMTDASRRPDVVVSTPAGLLSILNDVDKDFAMDWLAGVGHLVVDEADMLMTGGYRSKLQRIVELLRVDERHMAYDYLSYALGLSEEEVIAIPRHFKKALVKGGIQQMLDEGFEPEQESAKAAIQRYLSHGSRPSGRPPWHRQYVFVAATVPSEAKKNVATDIRLVCPDIEWVTTAGLHKTVDSVNHEWVDVSGSDPKTALFKALQYSGGGRVLVFAKDAASATQIHELLAQEGLDAVLFHSKLRTSDAARNMQLFREKVNRIMVCTDAASRGLDVANVTHVIQADFASSAIDFLHRVGRTGRAGAVGKVTSLFSRENSDLVQAIQQSISNGEPIEGAFSRRRSFRKKFKRYGKFVPRGKTAALAESTG